MHEEKRQTSSAEMKTEIRQMPSAELENLFFKIGFSHHIAIVKAIDSLDTRLFYIEKCAGEYWSYDTLKHHLKQKLHSNLGKITHNFDNTLPEQPFKQKALIAFTMMVFEKVLPQTSVLPLTTSTLGPQRQL